MKIELYYGLLSFNFEDIANFRSIEARDEFKVQLVEEGIDPEQIEDGLVDLKYSASCDVKVKTKKDAKKAFKVYKRFAEILNED